MTADRSEFNAWFNQLEAYCLKSERFYQELDCVSKEVLAISMVRWLEAAFYAGKAEGDQIATYSTDELKETVKQFFERFLNVVEERDSGKLFNPTIVSTCRAHKVVPLSNILETMRKLSGAKQNPLYGDDNE